MTIVLFTNDLMFQSRIASVVRAAGHSLVVARNVESLQQQVLQQPSLQESSPGIIVLDLAFRGLDLEGVVALARERYPSAKLVAYGPHVDVEGLQRAAALGIDEVLTRGQFDRNMATVLCSHDGQPPA